MAVEYDARRPRLPVGLAQRIDAARGQVPFNRFVVGALEKALGQAHVAPDGEAPRSKLPAREPESVPTSPAPSRASEPSVPKKDPLANVPGLKRGSEVPYRKPFVPRPKGS